MQLATSADGQPWTCSVWFAYDSDLNIYWFSSTERRHSKEIMKNKNVAGTMVLPFTPKDIARGVQFQGTAEQLTSSEDVDKAISVYVNRIFPIEKINDLVKSKNHAFYRAKPSLLVLLDPVNFPDKSLQELKM